MVPEKPKRNWIETERFPPASVEALQPNDELLPEILSFKFGALSNPEGGPILDGEARAGADLSIGTSISPIEAPKERFRRLGAQAQLSELHWAHIQDGGGFPQPIQMCILGGED